MASRLPLLKTKLQRPRVLRNVVPRPHLWAMLDRGSDKSLTLVCAGAGFGKSTLVSSWVEHTATLNPTGVPQPAAWLSLDENDSDPHVFLQYVVAALRTVAADACEETLSLLQSPQQPRRELLFTTLINEIALLPSRIVLVLDDYSVIHSEIIDEFISRLVRIAPQQLHLVLITRRNPPLPLPQLRAADAITEIRSQDLRFSHDETTNYLSRALATPLRESQIAALELRSEGWIAGLKLAVLSLRNNASSAAVQLEPVIGDATIDEYLADEVLGQQPPAVQSFLLRTSIVDHFCASLCQAILAAEEPGWDARTCIDWLVRSDLFVVSLANDQDWYRYHHLLLGMLRQRLAARQTSDEVLELHRRAAAWFADQGLTNEALHHAMLAGDHDLASQIMWPALPGVLNQEDRSTLERWLRLLPENFIQGRPELLLVKAWSLQFRWQLGAQADVLRQIESLLDGGNAEMGAGDAPDAEQGIRLQMMRAQLAVLRGQAAFNVNRPEQAIAMLQEALQWLAQSSTYLRGGAILYLGVSMQANGQSAAAERKLLELHDIYDDKRDGFALRICLSLCFIYLAEGRLEQVRQVAHDLLSQAKPRGLATMQSWAHYFLGLVYYHWNDLVPAATHFSAVFDRRYAANMVVVRNGIAMLSLVHQIQGHDQEASRVFELMCELDLDLQGREDVATRAMRAWLLLMQGDLAAAARWADAFTAPVPDQPLLWPVNLYIIKAHILLTRGSEADLVAACHVLSELHAIAIRTHNIRAEIEVLAMHALAVNLQGHYDQAQTLLRRAVTLAGPGGFVRVFVALGPHLKAMLLRLAQRGVPVRTIMAAFPHDLPQNGSGPNGAGAASSAPTSSARNSFPDPIVALTAREIDVLALLREPLSTKEIARRLAISPATVKRHTINIYGKLGVSGRWDAVARAEELGHLQQR